MNVKGHKMKRLIFFLGLAALMIVFAASSAIGGWRDENPQVYTYDSIGYMFVRDAAAGARTVTDTVTTWTATKNNRISGNALMCNKYEWDGGTYTTLGIQASDAAGSGFIWCPDEDSNYAYVVCDQSLDGSVWFPVDSLAWVTADTAANCRIKAVTLLPAPYFRLRTQGKTESGAVRTGSLMVWIYLK